MSRTVLAFGTFDRFHEGHKQFLQHALALGDRLCVSVARDAHVRTFKRKDPIRGEGDRLATIQALPYVDKAVLSDETLGSYDVIDRIRPDIIAIGHDQDALQADLLRWMSEKGQIIPMQTIGKYAREEA